MDSVTSRLFRDERLTKVVSGTLSDFVKEFVHSQQTEDANSTI